MSERVVLSDDELTTESGRPVPTSALAGALTDAGFDATALGLTTVTGTSLTEILQSIDTLLTP